MTATRIVLFIALAWATTHCTERSPNGEAQGTRFAFTDTSTSTDPCDTGRTGTIDVINYPSAPAAEYEEMSREIATILRKCFGCHNSGSLSGRMRATQLGTFNRARGVFDWGNPPRDARRVWNSIIDRLDLRATPGGAADDAAGRMPRLLNISPESDLARDLTANERTVLRAWAVARRDALGQEECECGGCDVCGAPSCEEDACCSASCEGDGEDVECVDCESSTVGCQPMPMMMMPACWAPANNMLTINFNPSIDPALGPAPAMAVFQASVGQWNQALMNIGATLRLVAAGPANNMWAIQQGTIVCTDDGQLRANNMGMPVYSPPWTNTNLIVSTGRNNISPLPGWVAPLGFSGTYADDLRFNGVSTDVLAMTQTVRNMMMMNRLAEARVGWFTHLASLQQGMCFEIPWDYMNVNPWMHFQTVMTHEIGHVLGLGHVTDMNMPHQNVMQPTIKTGDIFNVTATDEMALRALYGPGAPCGPPAMMMMNACADGICDGTETCSTCPEDCGTCPDVCGDFSCSAVEDCVVCPQDCGTCPDVCGDFSCSAVEDCVVCPQDCGACAPYCGDATCGLDETCTSCPQDCECCTRGCDCSTGPCLPDPIDARGTCSQPDANCDLSDGTCTASVAAGTCRR